MIPLLLALLAQSQDANRLTYLDESDPYYVHRKFPKLVTPQWVGEDGVEAVVVLAIDDMRGHDKWEAYLRPILERLKKIDGRAPVSIMTCTIDPNHPHLQKWLKEGLNIEVHTVDHPCPLLQGGDFAKAKSTYDRCVDLMNLIPNNKPVAFRMPCCDSLNTPSPRFYAEIFNRTTPHGNFLSIDTSVFNITTPNDPDLPKELTTDADGKEKFRKYLPFPSFVNTIEDYPYPYVIGKLCWEFPCIVPSDWEAQHLLKPFNPQMIADLKAALDAVVTKKGTFNLVFHPHGWIKAEQVVELIDYAVEKHGDKVMFLTFREALERLNRNFLGGHPLRDERGGDNRSRILDINNDGYLDVLAGDKTRLWSPREKRWVEMERPSGMLDPNLAFGVVRPDGFASVVTSAREAWNFDGKKWAPDSFLAGEVYGSYDGCPATRFRDLDGDGRCELITAFRERKIIWSWDGSAWHDLPFRVPDGLAFVDQQASPPRFGDAGLRFVDLNGDGRPDIVFSNEKEWSVHVFKDMKVGWEKVAGGKQGEEGAIPMIVRNGTNNGAWFHSKHLWVQNEDTAKMPNLVDRRSFEQLLEKK